MDHSRPPSEREEPAIVGLADVSVYGNSLAVWLGNARDIGEFGQETLTVYGAPDARVLYTRYADGERDDPYALRENMTRIGTRTFRRGGKSALYVTLSSAVLSVLGAGQGDTLELWASPGRLLLQRRDRARARARDGHGNGDS